MSTPSVTQSRDDVRLVSRPVPRLRRRVGAAAARRRLAWALIAPAALFMLLVHGLPTLGGVYLSFKQLNTFTFALLFDAPSAGLGNYSAILCDADSPLRPGFFGAVQNTAVYTLATVGGTLAGGLAIAVLLNRPIRCRRLIRTLMLTPWAVPSFVVALLWQFMWQSDVGIVNKVLVDYLGLLSSRPVWLSGEASLWAIIIPSIWRGLPFAMPIFFAGLQAIPRARSSWRSRASSRTRRWWTDARPSARSCASCSRTHCPGWWRPSSTRSCSRRTSCCSRPR